MAWYAHPGWALSPGLCTSPGAGTLAGASMCSRCKTACVGVQPHAALRKAILDVIFPRIRYQGRPAVDAPAGVETASLTTSPGVDRHLRNGPHRFDVCSNRWITLAILSGDGLLLRRSAGPVPENTGCVIVPSQGCPHFMPVLGQRRSCGPHRQSERCQAKAGWRRAFISFPALDC